MKDETEPFLEEPLPEELSPLNPEVLIVPGYLFFIESIPVPDELVPEELEEFAELSLESTAPFPLDQLFWGFFQADGSSKILIYAAHKERLRSNGYTDFEDYTWVLPDFATLFGAKFPEDTALLLKTTDSLSLLHFQKESRQPLNIVCRPPEKSEEAVVADLQELLPEAPSHVEPLAIQAERIELDDNELITFYFKTAEEEYSVYDIGEWTKISPESPALWRADIRSNGYKDAERKKRRLSGILARVAGWAAIFIIVLIVAEVVLFGGRFWLGGKEKRILEQEPAVLRIENQISLIEKLDQVATNEMRPINMLEAMNQVRPSGIYFTETSTDALNQITVEGVANTVTDFNRYITKLGNSGSFKLIGDPKYITRKGETTFSVTLTYNNNIPTEPETANTGEPAGDIEI
ncbi:MAG: PilN domain-containing protein [Verrucomicrobiota bacterium]